MLKNKLLLLRWRQNKLQITTMKLLGSIWISFLANLGQSTWTLRLVGNIVMIFHKSQKRQLKTTSTMFLYQTQTSSVQNKIKPSLKTLDSRSTETWCWITRTRMKSSMKMFRSCLNLLLVLLRLKPDFYTKNLKRLLTMERDLFLIQIRSWLAVYHIQKLLWCTTWLPKLKEKQILTILRMIFNNKYMILKLESINTARNRRSSMIEKSGSFGSS